MKDVTAAIIIEDEKVFLARRAPGDKFAGRWEFPGGKLEADETPEECLRRELFEEFGLETEVKEFYAENTYEYPQGSIRLLAYKVRIIRGDISLTVHDQYRWVMLKDLLNFNLLPADIPIACKLMNN